MRKGGSRSGKPPFFVRSIEPVPKLREKKRRDYRRMSSLLQGSETPVGWNGL
jgi:hypothetical protein